MTCGARGSTLVQQRGHVDQRAEEDVLLQQELDEPEGEAEVVHAHCHGSGTGNMPLRVALSLLRCWRGLLRQ